MFLFFPKKTNKKNRSSQLKEGRTLITVFISFGNESDIIAFSLITLNIELYVERQFHNTANSHFKVAVFMSIHVERSTPKQTITITFHGEWLQMARSSRGYCLNMNKRTNYA